MGLIKDFKDITSGYDKFKQMQNLAKTGEAVQKIEGQELKIADSTEIDPKNIVSDFKEAAVEKIDQLKGFVKDNPLFATFVEGLFAGLLAGKMEKKAELNKEIATYMTDLKANMEKTYAKTEGLAAKNKLRHFGSKSMNVAKGLLRATFFVTGAMGIPMSGVILTLTAGAGYPIAAAVAAPGAANWGLIGLAKTARDRLEYNSHQQIPSFNPKGERFLAAGTKENRFLTIPPGTNKLLNCEIIKDKNTGELYPVILNMETLPDTPVSLTKGHEKWNESFIKETVSNLSIFDIISDDDDYRSGIYKVKDYDAKINYENPQFDSEVNILSNAVDIKTTDHKKELEESKKTIKENWDNFSDKIQP